LGIPNTFSSMLIVAHAAAWFGKARPQVRFQVITANAAVVAEAVGRHHCDIGMAHSPVTDKSVTSDIVGESGIVAVMPADQPLSRLAEAFSADLMVILREADRASPFVGAR
jgi:DNA-binding transcriptional LysR family regulator